MSDTFSCMACGRLNPLRGANYSNKYCNNQCQQDHRKQLLTERRINDWQSECSLFVWKEIPSYIQTYLIAHRGHRCEVCSTETWQGQPIPLTAVQRNSDIYDNREENLLLICPNCRAQRK